jgi:hypothetical protein
MNRTHDNRDGGSLGDNGQVTLLMATRRGLPEHSGDAEPVMVDRHGDSIILTLDDGEQLVFDALELSSAVKPRLRLAA